LKSSRKSPALSDYLILTGLAVIFGSSFIFTALSVREFPPVAVVWLRLAMASALLIPVMIAIGQRLPPPSKVWGYIIASAVFGNAIPFTLITWGQTKVDAGLTAIFMAVMPLATILLAHLLTTDEKLNRWKLAGVICGIFGVIVLMGPSLLAGVGDALTHQIAILAAAICYAINAIITRQLVDLPKMSMMTALLICSAVILAPVYVLSGPAPMQVLSSTALLPVVALALGPTALATWLILVIIDRQGASFLSQINFMVPLFGVFFSAIFLSEVLSLNAWLALGIILIALWLSRTGSRK
jgi:drug/metabolite transporter (DMT)-like permease